MMLTAALAMSGLFLRISAASFLPHFYSTIAVNTFGCFILSFIFYGQKFNSSWQTAILVGLCGCLTTFSGTIFDAVKLIEKNFLIALLYCFTTLFFGFSAFWSGKLLAQPPL